MARRVYAYQVSGRGAEFSIDMLQYTEILPGIVKDAVGYPVMHYVADTETTTRVTRTFMLVENNEDLPHEFDLQLEYIGSWSNNSSVWHLFETKKPA